MPKPLLPLALHPKNQRPEADGFSPWKTEGKLISYVVIVFHSFCEPAVFVLQVSVSIVTKSTDCYGTCMVD